MAEIGNDPSALAAALAELINQEVEAGRRLAGSAAHAAIAGERARAAWHGDRVRLGIRRRPPSLSLCRRRTGDPAVRAPR